MKIEGYSGEFLSKEDIVFLHDKIIEHSENDDQLGFIDETGALFDSAYHSMFSGFGGTELYPSIEEKAAKLCYGIITGHVFRNANKRTGMMAMLQILDMNNISLRYTNDEMFDIINNVGSGKSGYEELLGFVRDRMEKREKK